MPFCCLANGKTIYSYTYSAAQWKELKASYKNHQLRMSCCPTAAIPKTNIFGTQFFAHARKGECKTALESKEHQFAKYIVAKTAHELGWEVSIEHRGESETHEGWVVDTLCKRGNIKIAVEIQWSPQTVEETMRRQARYKRSGIRGLWLQRMGANGGYHYHQARSQELPLFGLRLDPNTKQFMVAGVSQQKKGLFGKPPEMELSDFIRRMLQRQIRWIPYPEMGFMLNISLAENQCWKCDETTRIIDTVNLATPCADGLYNLTSVPVDKVTAPYVRLLNEPHYRMRYGYGQIKERYSKTEGKSYQSNGCVNCDALQGNWFRHHSIPLQAATDWIPIDFDYTRINERLACWLWVEPDNPNPKLGDGQQSLMDEVK
ncbi:hypothetical protein BKE30_14540 [Alkanindiges hydrocarboniclasticus]|uniref:Competence protein CoiA nuclease-like domain-containing protein n=1 Tax=Alkanindiges hydrocarboniclasticus TaxID=1907941 RepID=A0A1S8CQE0_9GAMM|nr:hypothetical protein [Alkanindiges hydrocarboniclasticus]ONG37348.1 hypothetical protein BKE30_14540 [Alkanindiges hydrocarboniclasticus]